MRKAWLGRAALAALLTGVLLVSCGQTQDGGSESPAGGAPGAAGEPDAISGQAGSAARGGSSAQGGSASVQAGMPALVAGAPAAGDRGGAPSGGQPGEAGADVGGASVGGADQGGAGFGGGAAGASSGGAGGAPAEPPDCDDGKPSTSDFYSVLYGCGHLTDEAPGGDDGWIYYDLGFYVDQKTGTAWTPSLGQGALDTLTTTCDALQIGTLVDWRAPTIDDVRASWAGGCPNTAPGGSCTIHEPDHLSSAEVYSNACSSCIGSGTSAYCADNVPFCLVLRTSSVCGDCAGDKGWVYGPTNGNFVAIDAATGFTMSCVISNLTGGVP